MINNLALLSLIKSLIFWILCMELMTLIKQVNSLVKRWNGGF